MTTALPQPSLPPPSLLLPSMSFDEVAAEVVTFLKRAVPLGFWSVSRFDGDNQVWLNVSDDVYGEVAGGGHPWADSFCRHVVAGRTPSIAPDAMAVPEYAASPVAARLDIGSYIGIPITAGDGELFGTLCGLDPHIRGADLLEHAPLLRLLSSLLGQVLRSETLRAEAAEQESEMTRRSLHDALTGLPNRVMFLARLARAVDLHAREQRPVSVLTFDLDDFAAINDSLGHVVGDALLVDVAARLHEEVRAGDTLARLSGDEFALVLEDGQDPLPVADRVIRLLSEPLTVGTRRVPVRTSVGVASLTAGSPTLSVEMLLANADTALYTAKRRGKARTVLFDGTMTVPGARVVALGRPLAEAVRRGEIAPAYQPIVAVATGRVVGFEALARWTHAGTVVPPDHFIPVAARIGMMPELTDHVMEVVAAQLAAWTRRTGRRDLTAAVNVPPSLVTDLTFPDRVTACIDRHGLGPGQLVLEVTEDALLADFPTAQRVTTRLTAAGAALSLDDFGTGWSSLQHLRRMPVESVKVDRAFAVDLDRDPEAEQFMRALLGLGRDLGLTVIVEGVERESQADVLHRLGAPLAQGWFYAGPGPAADFGPRLDRESTTGPVSTASARAPLTEGAAAASRRWPAQR